MSEIKKHIEEISSSPASKEELKLVLSVIDLTSLEGKDNEKIISDLCEKAKKIGKEWLTPKLFHFGASRLADNIFAQLNGEESISAAKGINY